jgi:putative hydrolase of the HAD superfamily
MALRAVTLDAVGTLLAVAEPVGATYARSAARHGIRVAAAELEGAFREAFTAAPPLAFPGASSARLADHERAWWHGIVQRAFGSAARTPAFEVCFAELYAHYARPQAWRLFPDVLATLTRLRAEGLRLAVVSNFDTRLVGLLAGLGLTPFLDAVVPSTHAGAAKPDPGIFHRALAALGVAEAQALHAGDGVVEDVEGARAAGLCAVLIDRTGRHAGPLPGVPTIATLAELPPLVAESGRGVG